jgi:hypothetical protein
MAQTPLELLTIIAAPALITNASSVLVLSTSNRFARAVDRARMIAAEIARAEHPLPTQRVLLNLATARTRTLVRALTAFYLAVGSFAFGTFAGLLGVGIERIGYPNLEAVITPIALGVVTVGTLSIATGAAMLVHETRLALHGLVEEARLHG